MKPSESKSLSENRRKGLGSTEQGQKKEWEAEK